MKTYILALPAVEVIYLLRAETQAAHGARKLNIGATEKEYMIGEDFDRSAYGLHDEEDFYLVTSITTLTIEPRVEDGFWILETVVERPLGPIPTSQEGELVRKDLTFDEFEAEFNAPGQKQVTFRLQAQTTAKRQDFDRWLADMRERHLGKPAVQQRGAAASVAQQPHIERIFEEGQISNAVENDDRVKEAVGVFRDPNALEAAVDELEVSGFDRAAISVLATDAKATEQVERFYRTVRDIEDSGRVQLGAFVSSNSRTEGKAAVVGIPLYIGGFAGAIAVAATGGALALAIAAAIAGGAAGAGLGAFFAAAIARHHAAHVREQLDKGGLVLWVNVPDPDAEKRAVAILNNMGARHVHVHEIKREWSSGEVPLGLKQADPFLERDPS